MGCTLSDCLDTMRPASIAYFLIGREGGGFRIPRHLRRSLVCFSEAYLLQPSGGIFRNEAVVS